MITWRSIGLISFLILLGMNMGLADQEEVYYQGTIGTNIHLEMRLTLKEDKYTGALFYNRHGIEISLSGKREIQGALTLRELDKDGRPIGIFHGKLKSNGELEGNWSKPDGSQSKPFLMTESAGYGLNAVQAGTSLDVSEEGPGAYQSSPIHALLCAKERDCKVVYLSKAVANKEGNLRLVELQRPPPPEQGGNNHYEAWLVWMRGAVLLRKQLVTSTISEGGSISCNSPRDPDSGGWQIDLSTDILRIYFAPFRPVVEKWWVFNLSPFRLISERESQHHIAWGIDVEGPYFDLNWDWDRFSGQGYALEVNDCKNSNEKTWPRRGPAFLPIPQMQLSTDFLATGWKMSRLGTASLSIGTADAPGFLLAGQPPKPSLMMKLLLASSNDLLIDIPRTNFVVSTGSWLHSDHLEIWQPEFGGVQWGIRLSDGKVFPAWGHPKEMPIVEKVVKDGPDGSKITGLKIHLVTAVGNLSSLAVSYSTSKDGKKVDSLISTSDLCFGQPDSLGLVKEIPISEATYNVHDGQLDAQLVSPLSDAALCSRY